MKREFERYGRPAVGMVPGVSSSGFPGYRPGVPVRVSREDASVAELENHELVEAALAEHYSNGRLLVEVRGKVRRLDMTATDHRFLRYRNFRIGEGRFFNAADVERARPVAVLGYEAAQELLDDPRRDLGRTIRISGEPFELIGILHEKSGRQYNNTNRPENRLLLVPNSSAEARLGFDEDRVSVIWTYTRPGADSQEVLRGMVASLAKRRGLHPEDTDAFRHFDMSNVTRLLDLMYAGFALFMGVAGTVTLLIGGVGIANYHLAMLAEREVEIGVAKAIGARNGSLMAQSVLESLLVSGVAALAGVALGWVGCSALEHLTPPGMFPTPVVSGLVIGITLCALVGVAVVAALVPALRVRSMDISIALRAEI
jgi:putative ABC transport system permease protein